MPHGNARWETPQPVTIEASGGFKLTRNCQLRRILIALTISVTLNIILGIVASFIYGQRDQRHPIIAELLDVLGRPATAIGEHLAPSGHSATHFFVAAAIAAIFSLIFYAFLTWVALSTFAHLRREHSNKSGSLLIPK